MANGIAVDTAGNAYVTGVHRFDQLPDHESLPGGLCGGGNDAFVAKLNPTGTALIYSTYLGGNSD